MTVLGSSKPVCELILVNLQRTLIKSLYKFRHLFVFMADLYVICLHDVSSVCKCSWGLCNYLEIIMRLSTRSDNGATKPLMSVLAW